jgi:DNA-binding NarL/FixJ family response regulator
MNASTIRVLIAEDHGIVRGGIRALLERTADIEVVAEAADGHEALKLIGEHLPDVVLMDITMPGIGGMQAAVRVAVEYPQVRVLMLSMQDNEEYVWQALRAGAAGYLLKDGDPSELELAVRSVARGASYLSAAVSQHVAAYVRRQNGERGPMDHLTPRQLEIVRLIAESNTNREIAQLLSISVKTVETHRSQLMERLGLHDAAGLVRYAIRLGLVSASK